MADYSPLRDAFRDMNRLLIDRQQFNAQMEDRKSKHEERMIGLQSQIEQQKFNNNMRNAQMELAINGDQRAAATAKQTILNSNRNYKQQQDEFAWKKKVYGDAGPIRQANLSDLKERTALHHKQNQIAQNEIDKQADDVRPTPMSISIFSNGDAALSSNPEYSNKLLAVLDPTGEKGLVAQENGRILTSSGTPFVASKRQLRDILPITSSLNAEFDQTPAKVQATMTQLQGEMNALVSRKNELKKSYNPMSDQAAARVEVQMKDIKKEHDKIADFFKPANQIAYYSKKEQTARKAVAYARSVGATALATDQMSVANRAAAVQSSLLTKLYGSKPKTGKYQKVFDLYADPNNSKDFFIGDRKAAPGGWLDKAIYDPETPEAPWIINGKRYAQPPMGVVVKASTVNTKGSGSKEITASTLATAAKDIRMRIAPQSDILPKGSNQLNAANAANTKFNEFVRKGSVKTQEDLASAIESSILWVKKTHNQAYEQLQKMKQQVANGEKTPEWYDQMYKKYSAIALKQLNYVPTDTYESQVTYEYVDREGD